MNVKSEVCVLLVLCVICGHEGQYIRRETSETCEVTIQKSNCSVPLSPGSHSNLADLQRLQDRFKKLENQMTKGMKHMSKRVMRGARKLEILVNNFLGTGPGAKSKSTRCPEGYVTFDKWLSCYKFSTFNASWYEARDFCTGMDSDLVSIDSLKEQFLVSFFIRNNPGT